MLKEKKPTHFYAGNSQAEFHLTSDSFIYTRTKGNSDWFLFGIITKKTSKGFYYYDCFSVQSFVSNRKLSPIEQVQ